MDREASSADFIASRNFGFVIPNILALLFALSEVCTGLTDFELPDSCCESIVASRSPLTSINGAEGGLSWTTFAR
jgi:hypothetical protein